MMNSQLHSKSRARPNRFGVGGVPKPLRPKATRSFQFEADATAQRASAAASSSRKAAIVSSLRWISNSKGAISDVALYCCFNIAFNFSCLRAEGVLLDCRLRSSGRPPGLYITEARVDSTSTYFFPAATAVTQTDLVFFAQRRSSFTGPPTVTQAVLTNGKQSVPIVSHGKQLQDTKSA